MLTDTLWKKMLIGAIVCLALGSASGLSTVSEINSWFTTINKPTWNPPNWIFGPMWTTLYILMGAAFGRIWHLEDSKAKKTAMIFFVVQFVLNLTWTPVFFGLHQISLALGIILLMLTLIVITLRQFMRLDKIAGAMLIPYMLWVAFASFLNYTIMTLN